MQQANPKNFTQQTRQLMLKAIVDLESLVCQRDMLLEDLRPRNVMIMDATFSHENGRNLVSIDFANVLFGRVPDDMRKYRRESLANTYLQCYGGETEERRNSEIGLTGSGSRGSRMNLPILSRQSHPRCGRFTITTDCGFH